jgi:hypothetical protein
VSSCHKPSVALVDDQGLSDDALARLARGATPVTGFPTRKKGADELRMRWDTTAPDTPLEGLGQVEDVHEAIIEGARLKIPVVAAAAPADADRFVGLAVQGAAAATELEVAGMGGAGAPGQPGRGPRGTADPDRRDVGLRDSLRRRVRRAARQRRRAHRAHRGRKGPRTRGAVDDALYTAIGTGVRLTRRSDASPVDAVLKGPFQIAVHPVLDVPGGRALLRRRDREEPVRGRPAAVVRLIEEFAGDVVAVFDGVHLVHGAGATAKVTAAVALSLTEVAGVGAAAAAPAMAAPAAVASASASAQASTVPGVIVSTPGGHAGVAHGASFHIVNHMNQAVTLVLPARWTHPGSHTDHVETFTFRVSPGQTHEAPIPRPVGPGQSGYRFSPLSPRARGSG